MILGILHGCVVGVLVAFPVWELCAFGEDAWRRVWWWGLFGVGGTNVVCIVLEHVSESKGVLEGSGWGCLYGVCCGWECIAPVSLLWCWCGAGFFYSFGVSCYLMVGCGLVCFRRTIVLVVSLSAT